ncbi:MAG: hypothetical protein ACP5EQ_07330, partial [Candidatus Cloacimonadia bacterium]
MEFNMNIKHFFVIFLTFCIEFSFSCSYKNESGLKLPEPTGPFDVGTAWFYFTDSSRFETFTQDPDDFRELAVRVWYPAEIKKSDKPCPYIEHTAVFPEQGISDKIRASLDKLNERLKSIKTHSYKNAPAAVEANPFP